MKRGLTEEELVDFKRRIAGILFAALHIETHLEMAITAYVFKGGGRMDFFNDHFLLRTSFDRKVQLFEIICKTELLFDQNVKNTIRSIKFVQELRNKAAHWQTTIGLDNIPKLMKRTTYVDSKRDIG
ncbi:MAG: hypothetical protein ACTSUP_02855 [Candidatus Heimdallarchaeaceae archaeon]